MTESNDALLIHGGHALHGELRVHNAKNSALYLMLATLLTDEPVVLDDVPRLSDVQVTEEILRHVGAEVSWRGSELHVRARRITTCHAPYRLVSKMRASFVAMGALLARCGEARISMPGGCAFGPRPVDRHLQAFSDLGVHVEEEEGDFLVRRDGRLSGQVVFEDRTVGGTVNILLAAALAGDEVIIENAALEPEIADLADMLEAMGASVEGAGTSVIRVRGSTRLHGVRRRPIPDRIEAGTYLLAVAASRGRATLGNVRPEHLSAVLDALVRTGVTVETTPDSVTLDAGGTLSPVDLVAEAYPGLPTDLQAPFGALLATVPGRSTVRDTVYPDRYTHVDELAKLGADMTVSERTLVIHGRPLEAGTVHAADIRAGGALVVAALAASGISEIRGVGYIDRGYEDLTGGLRALGADARREAARPPLSVTKTGTYGA